MPQPWQGYVETSNCVMAFVPLAPRLTCFQKQSRPTPKGDTTPMPVITTPGTPLSRMRVTIIQVVRQTGTLPRRVARMLALGASFLPRLRSSIFLSLHRGLQGARPSARSVIARSPRDVNAFKSFCCAAAYSLATYSPSSRMTRARRYAPGDIGLCVTDSPAPCSSRYCAIWLARGGCGVALNRPVLAW